MGLKKSDEQKKPSGLDHIHYYVKNKFVNYLCKMRDRPQRFNILQSRWNILWRDFHKFLNVLCWCLLLFLLWRLIYFACFLFLVLNWWVFCSIHYTEVLKERDSNWSLSRKVNFCLLVLSFEFVGFITHCNALRLWKRKIQTEPKGQLAADCCTRSLINNVNSIPNGD